MQRDTGGQGNFLHFLHFLSVYFFSRKILCARLFRRLIPKMEQSAAVVNASMACSTVPEPAPNAAPSGGEKKADKKANKKADKKSEDKKELSPTEEYYKSRADMVDALGLYGQAYPHKFQTTMLVPEFIAKYTPLLTENGQKAEEEVGLAGRVMAIRRSGAKLFFFLLPCTSPSPP